jgi:acyl carrier protein
VKNMLEDEDPGFGASAETLEEALRLLAEIVASPVSADLTLEEIGADSLDTFEWLSALPFDLDEVTESEVLGGLEALTIGQIYGRLMSSAGASGGT